VRRARHGPGFPTGTHRCEPLRAEPLGPTLTGMHPISPVPLPRTVRLAPHRTLLPLGAETRMIGLDPASALLVEGLGPALTDLLAALRSPGDPRALVAGSGDEAAAAAALLCRLVEAGAVVDARGEQRRASYRAEAVVHVHGGGPLADGVAAGLIRAGIGTVRLVVPQRCPDASGHRPGRAVAGVDPQVCHGSAPQRSRPDLAVLADALVPDPGLVAQLVAAGTAHLPVCLRDGVGVVGPLVLPGRSPCLHCLDLHRCAREPAWPRILAQLGSQAGSAETECVAATVALATAQALAVLDTPAAPPPALAATLHLDPATATLVRRPWVTHPGCGCARPDRHPVACESPGRPGTIGT